jgi:hypothetical protein
LAVSKIYISFDEWTIKGGKRGFSSIVAYFSDASGTVRDLPIALPQLTGAYTGERIAEVVAKTLKTFNISSNLGYFVLDNAYANDTAITKLGKLYDFKPCHRCLRCGPHTLNIVSQMLIFGYNACAYNNDTDEHKIETAYLRNCRQNGPLGVLIDILNYIKTPQQHDLFADFQRRNNETPAQALLEPVKPVVTRWNSFYNTFPRAVQLHHAVNAYAQFHIERTKADNVYAQSRNNQLPRVPTWLRSNGLTAAD